MEARESDAGCAPPQPWPRGRVRERWHAGVAAARCGAAERIEHLTTQMKFRLEEGANEAMYEIGVRDDGTPCGLPQAELEASLRTLEAYVGQCDVMDHVCVCVGGGAGR